MGRTNTPDSTLENLKKEARRWLKALRDDDESARARLNRALPGASNDPGLREVQHALALEHGFTGWSAFKEALTDQTFAQLDHEQRATWFLQHACNDHHYMNGAASHATHQKAAARLLSGHPEIALDSLYTAVVCGEVDEVVRRLAERPPAASESGGPKDWPPLLYLCFGRVPGKDDSAVTLARILLDHGDDPNTYIDAPCDYSALVAVAGEGEEDTPAHPQADALTEVLLERGAEPYDIQLLYNTQFRDDVRWLEWVYAHAVKLGRRTDWDDPQWSMLDFGGYGKGARFLLRGAVSRNHLQRAEWLLAEILHFIQNDMSGAGRLDPLFEQYWAEDASIRPVQVFKNDLDGELPRLYARWLKRNRTSQDMSFSLPIHADRTQQRHFSNLAGNPTLLIEGILGSAGRGRADIRSGRSSPGGFQRRSGFRRAGGKAECIR